jgi:hypothetical protein
MVEKPNEMIPHNNKVLTLIKQFDEKLNSSFKSDEKIEADSAVWNIEALQNYTLAYPDSAAKDFKVIKTTYTVPVDANGMILMTDVQTVYDLMESDLITSLDLIESEVKYIRFSDVALDSIIGGTAYMSITAGFGFNWLMNTYWGFNEDDDWIWGTLSEDYGVPPMGKCDGTQIGVSDGSNELAWRLNNPLVQPAQPLIYTDLVTLSADGFYFEDAGVARIFVGWDYPTDECLTNDTLTYFLIQADDIINTYDYEGGLRPANKSFINIEIKDRLAMYDFSGWHYHEYLVTYGIPTVVGLPD